MNWMSVSNENGEKRIALRDVSQVEQAGLDDGLRQGMREWEESRKMGRFRA